jgi:hypothetical protein
MRNLAAFAVVVALALEGCTETAPAPHVSERWTPATYALNEKLWERFGELAQHDPTKHEQLRDVMTHFDDAIQKELDTGHQMKLLLLLQDILDGRDVPDVELRRDPELDAKLAARITLTLRNTSLDETMLQLSSAIGIECVIDPSVYADGTGYGLVDFRAEDMDARTYLWFIAMLKDLRYVIRDGVLVFLPRAEHGALVAGDEQGGSRDRK